MRLRVRTFASEIRSVFMMFFIAVFGLPGEPAQGVNDNHFKPVEPVTARLSLIYYF